MPIPIEIEIALEDPSHATGLEALGVHRVELCANLAEGGLTPTVGQARAVVAATSLPVYAMLRPRAGNFTYTSMEVEQLMMDFEALATTGIAGVVFGALRADGSLDEDVVDRVLRAAREAGLGFTFHRAIDVSYDPEVVLWQLHRMGVDRVLTSGGARVAPSGLQALRYWSTLKECPALMAGSGVHAEVVPALWHAGIRQFHCTARRPMSLGRDPEISLGFADRWVFDEEKVRALVAAVAALAARDRA